MGRAGGVRALGQCGRRGRPSCGTRRGGGRRVPGQVAVKRLSALALVGFAAFCGPAQGQSNPAAAIYDAAEIETWRPRYQKGWMTNYRGVFLPDFTAEEKARL